MKFNLRKIMLKAWELYRKGRLTFAECLHRSWLSAKADQRRDCRERQSRHRGDGRGEHMERVAKAGL